MTSQPHQMRADASVAVVIPAYNEEARIGRTLATVPASVRTIYAVNDASTDSTAAAIRRAAETDSRIVLVDLPINSGVGGAIVAGYLRVIESSEDIAVVMAGDGQMDPGDLDDLLAPVKAGLCDYAKGNRFLSDKSSIKDIPRHRLLGNLGLSALTKIASGYWHVSDSQCGYTAINRRALLAVDWSECYPRYGCPNDYLVRLNIANMKVMDVPVRAVYGDDWRSHMRPGKVVFPMLRLLSKLFVTRMFRKYVVLNGHPIALVYTFSCLGFVISMLLFLYVAVRTISTGIIPQTATILWGMGSIVSIQLLLQAFEMDHRDNEWLCAHRRD
ncbi:MAG TPA: glycosyltransferase family 2 protein [Devosiaceae bacterium]|jgi:glycosyltransferase involved in cell wall biosynthesis